MRALLLRSADGDGPAPFVVQRPLPAPGRGEVLVRVAASPINPNDLLFLADRYEVKKPLPVVPGFEGSGTVVASGGGFMARTLVGRRVACAAGPGDGLWAEYAVVPAMRCVPLRGHVGTDEGATMLTNPLTAWVLASRARAEGHRAVVLTAAAGALGRMLCRVLRAQGTVVIAVVRRAGQVEVLRGEGVPHVIDSSVDGWEDELRAVAARAGVSLVAGETTGRIASAVPAGSVIRVYGMLSDAPVHIDPGDLVFRGVRLNGFTMYEWLRTTGVVSQLLAVLKVQGMLAGPLRTTIRARLPLADHAEALRLAREGTTEGKVLFAPDGSADR